LSPIKKEDFIEVAENVWQCSRNGAMFLTEDKTKYYHVDDKQNVFEFEDSND
jgi:hypothetical protein